MGLRLSKVVCLVDYVRCVCEVGLKCLCIIRRRTSAGLFVLSIL